MPSFSATTVTSDTPQATSAAHSVGVVHPQVACFDAPLPLTCGKTLSHYEIAYETYGTLNSERTLPVTTPPTRTMSVGGTT